MKKRNDFFLLRNSTNRKYRISDYCAIGTMTSNYMEIKMIRRTVLIRKRWYWYPNDPTQLVSYGEEIPGEDSNDRNVKGGDMSGDELLHVHKE